MFRRGYARSACIVNMEHSFLLVQLDDMVSANLLNLSPAEPKVVARLCEPFPLEFLLMLNIEGNEGSVVSASCNLVVLLVWNFHLCDDLVVVFPTYLNQVGLLGLHVCANQYSTEAISQYKLLTVNAEQVLPLFLFVHFSCFKADDSVTFALEN